MEIYTLHNIQNWTELYVRQKKKLLKRKTVAYQVYR